MIARKTPLRSPKKAPLARVPIKKVSKPIKKSKAWKFVKTHLAECDDAFAREIKARDGHCMYQAGTYRCQATENLTCSHYIGRGNWNTRFDKHNCITLCIRHHFMDRDTAWEFQKAQEEKHGWDGRYTIFMKNWLGEWEYSQLIRRARSDKSRKEAIIEAQKRYNLRQPTEEENLSPSSE